MNFNEFSGESQGTFFQGRDGITCFQFEEHHPMFSQVASVTDNCPAERKTQLGILVSFPQPPKRGLWDPMGNATNNEKPLCFVYILGCDIFFTRFSWFCHCHRARNDIRVRSGYGHASFNLITRDFEKFQYLELTFKFFKVFDIVPHCP